ncbi:hypothetical protein E4656_01665 [Natronospirillum operosum]|uniref:MotA/TolQ/ExbB proton channel domain-containing protein n=1 Tax=Natronospirillum operosum TaxID=2759953 RepID=A0A4Z0W971_9GAMM|nr:hypothetical protein [Natronospirillum operosum]TGG95159.1 hypothetical protein E4656_01665 [Natronospirillum operosum]
MPILWIAVGIISGIGLLTLYFHFLPRSQSVASQAPSILTTLGIFGTFVGVALGLYEFDSTDIEDSVPVLLDGLKFAFWTSIAGLSGALSIKMRYAWIDMRTSRGREGDSTVGALIAAVERLDDNAEKNLGELVRQTQHNSEQLSRHQEEMVEANTRALSAAIKEIISDFNDRIEVQYGDNFRQLNESVGHMLTWQKQHEENVRQVVAELEKASRQMVEATGAYEKLMHQTQSFSSVAEGMESLLTGLNQQSEQLAQYLGTMASMVQEAQKGLPDLEQRIGVLTTGLADAIEQQNNRMQQVVDQTGRQWLDSSNKLATELSEGVIQVQRQLVEQAGRALTQSEHQLQQLDETLQTQLTQSLQTFGFQLTALSEKFVNDYTPLTERLQTLVKAAEQSKPVPEGGSGQRGSRRG